MQEMKCLPSSFNNRAVKETDKDKHRIRDQMNNESKRNISRKKSRQICIQWKRTTDKILVQLRELGIGSISK